MNQFNHISKVKEGHRYNEAFKHQLAGRILSGESITQLAREVKIPSNTLGRWVKDYQLSEPSKVTTSINTAHTPSPSIDLLSLQKRIEALEKALTEQDQYIRKLERKLLTFLLED